MKQPTEFKEDVSTETRMIYLNRQGVSKNFNTSQTKDIDFYIDISEWQGTRKYIAEVSYSGDKKRWPGQDGQTAFTIPDRETWRLHQEKYKEPLTFTLETIIKKIEVSILEHFKQKIKISKHIMAYMYKDNNIGYYDYTLNDFYFSQAVYCTQTDTIRATDNTCLIAWSDGDIHKPDFKVDALNYENPRLMKLLKKAHTEFLKECNQRGTDINNKGWLAWLVSEYMKTEDIGKPCRPIKTMIPANYWENDYNLSEVV